MSSLSQNERQALNDVFSAIDTNETQLSKVKNHLSHLIYFLKYFLKEKARTAFLAR